MLKGRHASLAQNAGHSGTMRDGNGGYRGGVSRHHEGGLVDIRPIQAAQKAEAQVSELFKGIGMCVVGGFGLHAATHWNAFIQSVTPFFR